MTCRGSLDNVSDAPDTFYSNVIWIGHGRGKNCFFRINAKAVFLAVLKVCDLDQPCEVKAIVREITMGGGVALDAPATRSPKF